ncbi:hypothetical protein [Paraliobacillus sp. JSM ZJ581]|uniref:hypothetical protein n=1 Tax=Paraliobacillus sp. JSM ZJ581 TaxID=3342118 RepID=UPI0035A94266
MKHSKKTLIIMLPHSLQPRSFARNTPYYNDSIVCSENKKVYSHYRVDSHYYKEMIVSA